MCLDKLEERPNHPFNDPNVRRVFRIKVFMVLTGQLSFTIPMILVTYFVDEVNDYFRENFWWMFIGCALVLMTNIALCYCGYFLNRCPYIGVIAVIMTIGFTLILMVLTAISHEGVVFQALGCTVGIFAVLCILSIIIPYDISVLWFIPLVLGLVALVSMLVFLFIPSKVLYLVICGLVLTACIISMLISLQQILGGKHTRFYYYPEDYAIAAIFLYSDMMNILMVIMGIMNATGD